MRNTSADAIFGRHLDQVLAVGRRVGALLQQLVADFEVTALPDGDGNAGLRRERIGPFLRQALVLRVVDRDAAVLREGRSSEGRERDACGQAEDTELHFCLTDSRPSRRDKAPRRTKY